MDEDYGTSGALSEFPSWARGVLDFDDFDQEGTDWYLDNWTLSRYETPRGAERWCIVYECAEVKVERFPAKGDERNAWCDMIEALEGMLGRYP